MSLQKFNMATLSLQQIKERHGDSKPKKIINNGNTGSGRTLSTQDIQRESQTRQRTAGNQFEPKKPDSFLGKARDFTTNLIGGGKLAEGIGQAFASGEVKKQRDESLSQLQNQQGMLIDRLNQQKQSGEDTSATINALKDLQSEFKVAGDTASDFSQSLPSGKQLFGSAARLAALAGTGALARGAASLTGVGKASGTLATGVRGAGAGVIAGGAEGAIQGAGAAAEQDADAGEIALAGGIGAGVGGALGGSLGLLGGAAGRAFQKYRNAKQVRNNLIQEGATDSRTARYFRDGSGQIQRDPVAQEAVKQGVNEGTVALIKGSSQTDRKKMQEAYNIYQRAKTDPKFDFYNRSSDIPGETVMNRYEAVKNVNKQAAEQLDEVAQGLRGNTVNPQQPAAEFADDLSKMDIEISNGEIDFSGSIISDSKPAQKLITSIVNKMKNTSNDAWELHKLKRSIDENIASGRSEGLAGQAKVVAQRLRKNIDDILDSNFDAYNQVNTQYADTINALNEFDNVAGSGFNPDSNNVAGYLGTRLRQTTGNAMNRVPLIDAIDDLERTARKYGKNFDDDVVTQVDFVNELEKLFGSQGDTTFQSQIQQGVEQAGSMKGSTMWETAANLSKKGVDISRDINEEALESSIERLLQQ